MTKRLLAIAMCLGAQAFGQSAMAPQAAGAAQPSSARESLERKLENLKNPPPAQKGAARMVELSDVELSEYLNTALRAKLVQAGVSEARVQLDRDRLLGSAVVDLDLVRRRLPEGVGGGLLNPLSYLSGKVPSDFSGRLVTGSGFGTFELEGVHFGPVTVPVAVVGQMIASSTKNAENPEGVDIKAPFRLPYAIKRVRLQPGKALVEY